MSENEVIAMDITGRIYLLRHYRLFLAKANSILNKIQSRKWELKALIPNLSENYVMAMARKGRKDPQYALQTTFSENHVNLI